MKIASQIRAGALLRQSFGRRARADRQAPVKLQGAAV